jgi:3-hydroxyacyl-[acyl-carrier-protein] dehydratase
VDEILTVSEEVIKGVYTFEPDVFFYRGHFKDNPVTPGVILTECMAQIGLVCFGIYLLGEETILKKSTFALSSNEMEFYIPVYPGEKVTVVSEKIYFRFQKLKCKVRMMNEKAEVVALGTLSGMMINGKKNKE